MPQQASLRVYGHGQVEVELVAAYLGDLKHAYDSVFMFETLVDSMWRASREYASLWPPQGLVLGWPPTSRRTVHEWAPTANEVASAVPRAEQLVLLAVSVASPGFWEFLGTLNPLEVLRRYLNDRHERRKDREYRESAEARRMALENLSLESKVISDWVKSLKEVGATDRDLAPLLNALVYRPLMALNRYQDLHVIENAEFPLEQDRSEGP
jgi:hypothetical protein